MDKMTGKERLTAAMRGEPVDRVPIWLREGFPIGEDLSEADSFQRSWQEEPLYRALYDDVARVADPIVSFGLRGWSNRFLMVPPQYIHSQEVRVNRDLKRVEGWIETPRGRLTFVDEFRRGYETAWHVKTLVETVDDLKMLFEVPYSFDPNCIEPILTDYHRVRDCVGDRGIVRIGLSSPMVSVSGCMKLETFLEFSLTEKAL